MNPDLRERLRRLGVHKGTANLRLSQLASESSTAPPVYARLEPRRTPFGYAYVSHSTYPLTHRHGERTLDAVLRCPPNLLAGLVAGRASFQAVDLRQAIFLDTETTGLSGGAGTLVFLVGLGYFTDDRFVVEQFFLRDPAEEAAMLCAVDRCLNDRRHVVTFNGQAFDVPLLESRFILSRIAPPFAEKQHLDLLLPARRTWRNSLDSCSLGSLEFHLLGVRREQRDVPGSVIPFLYREYLAAGGGDLNEDMQRVMYHNLNDILSMVTLVARLTDALTRPSEVAEHFGAARFYERIGDDESAERSYRMAVAGWEQAGVEGRDGQGQLRRSLPVGSQVSWLRHFARFLKRRGRSGEALALWQRLADADDVEGLIEVAKHYEWRTRDLEQALVYARRALRANTSPMLRGDIERRVARLERKLKAPKNLREL